MKTANFADFGPRFRVHLLRHFCSLLWLLSLFWTFWVFFELDFNSDCIRPKKESSLNSDWIEIANTCIRDDLLSDRSRSLICSSFDCGPCMICLVRCRLFFFFSGATIIYCNSRTRLGIALAFEC